MRHHVLVVCAIDTPRLWLWPLGPEHTKPYARLLRDPSTYRFVVDGGSVGPQAIRERIARKQRAWEEGTAATWAIQVGRAFAGYVALHGLGARRVALSYAIAPRHRRRGYAREALIAIMGKSIELGFVELEARTHLDNEGSASLLLGVGFSEQAQSLDPPRRVFRWRRRLPSVRRSSMWNLTTRRMLMYALGPQEGEIYATLLREPSTRAYVLQDGPAPIEAALAKIAEAGVTRTGEATLTWELNSRTSFVGYVALHGLGRSRVSMSFGVAPEFLRLGYAREAVDRVLTHASRLNVQEIESRVLPGNAAAVALLSGLGFSEVARAEDPPRRVFVWLATGPMAS